MFIFHLHFWKISFTRYKILDWHNFCVCILNMSIFSLLLVLLFLLRIYLLILMGFTYLISYFSLCFQDVLWLYLSTFFMIVVLGKDHFLFSLKFFLKFSDKEINIFHQIWDVASHIFFKYCFLFLLFPFLLVLPLCVILLYLIVALHFLSFFFSVHLYKCILKFTDSFLCQIQSTVETLR